MKKTPRTDLIIFLDIDGVIADFDSHAVACNKVKENGKLDYDALDFDWWSTIPVTDGAREFYKELQEIATVKFLTGPMMTPDCHHGKAKWIIDFAPQGKWALSDLIICPSKDKHFLAFKDRILIDDRENNVDDWKNAGGVPIHHKGDFANTLKQVKHFMYLYETRQKLSAKENDKDNLSTYKTANLKPKI